MREVKKINKVSCANVVGLIYGLIGFLFSSITILFSFINIIKENNNNESLTNNLTFNIGGGILFLILISITTGLFGWLAGYITSFFYNIIAKKIGGIKIELTEKKKKEEKNLLN